MRLLYGYKFAVVFILFAIGRFEEGAILDFYILSCMAIFIGFINFIANKYITLKEIN